MGAPLQSEQKSNKRHKTTLIWLGILTLSFLLIFLFQTKSTVVVTNQKNLKWEDVAYIDENGVPQLKEWRQQELNKKMEEFEAAEQYALLARTNGEYTCYHCKKGTCFLQKGMVWKYGVTRKGMSGRYATKWLMNMNLVYQVQYLGSYQECLIKEKTNILHYPLHPDNLIRDMAERMARPPGNQNDN